MPKLVPKAPKGSVNTRLSGCPGSLLISLLGKPRKTFSQECQSVTNPSIQKLMVYGVNISPDPTHKFVVSGLKPVVYLLKCALADLHESKPALFKRLGNVGMLCCRYIRGSSKSLSNHSWGTAVDFTIDGVVDPYGDDKMFPELLEVYAFLKNWGFYWGVSFKKEDAMHFEASAETIRVLKKLNWHLDDKNIDKFFKELAKEVA